MSSAERQEGQHLSTHSAILQLSKLLLKVEFSQRCLTRKLSSSRVEHSSEELSSRAFVSSGRQKFGGFSRSCFQETTITRMGWLPSFQSDVAPCTCTQACGGRGNRAVAAFFVVAGKCSWVRAAKDLAHPFRARGARTWGPTRDRRTDSSHRPRINSGRGGSKA